MAAFPVVELSHPTLLNLVAIGCYALAMLFHIISFTTDNWSYMKLEGVPWKMGLWRGCYQRVDGGWNCTAAVFQDKVFQTGMSSDWHSGSQVIMTLALVALFLLEFAIICYACIKRLEPHRDRVTGAVLGLSLTAAFCHFLVLVMYGSEVAKVPESYVLGSYGLVVICMLLELAIPVLVLFDKSKRFPADHVFIVTHVKRKARSKRTGEPEVARHTVRESADARDGEPGPHRISMSTRGPETLKKFAPYTIEDHAPPMARTTRDFRWSTSSLADSRRRDSTGSSASHFTQNTMVTNVSYDLSVDRQSVESLV